MKKPLPAEIMSYSDVEFFSRLERQFHQQLLIPDEVLREGHCVDRYRLACKVQVRSIGFDASSA